MKEQCMRLAGKKTELSYQISNIKVQAVVDQGKGKDRKTGTIKKKERQKRMGEKRLCTSLGVPLLYIFSSLSIHIIYSFIYSTQVGRLSFCCQTVDAY